MGKSRNSKWYERSDFDDNDYYEEERRSKKRKFHERKFDRALKSLDKDALLRPDDDFDYDDEDRR